MEAISLLLLSLVFCTRTYMQRTLSTCTRSVLIVVVDNKQDLSIIDSCHKAQVVFIKSFKLRYKMSIDIPMRIILFV